MRSEILLTEDPPCRAGAVRDPRSTHASALCKLCEDALGNAQLWHHTFMLKSFSPAVQGCFLKKLQQQTRSPAQSGSFRPRHPA